MTGNDTQGLLPPLRPGRGTRRAREARASSPAPLSKATLTHQPRRGRLWLGVVLAVLAVCTTIAVALDLEGTVDSPAPQVAQPVSVPKLTLTPETDESASDVLLPGRRLEADPEDDGCHLLAGRKVALVDFHIVQTDVGEIVTARAPLWCVDGTDYHLFALLDCARTQRCELISLYSPTTHTYYRLPAETLALVHGDGPSDEHFPTHVVLQRPARLREYGGPL